MSDRSDDQTLIAEALRGSGSAFVTLVQRHQQPLRSFLRRVCRDFVEADDIAQETFLTAWSRLDGYRGQSSFRSWLCGMAYRKALEAGRSDRRRRAREEQAGRPEAGDSVGGDPDERMDLDRAFRTLSRAQRAAVVLCWADGYSHADAAETLNMPIGTLKSHLVRSRERLRLALGEADGLE
jgi:RNA polymerase sigma-70 factor (ECF subfamily)